MHVLIAYDISNNKTRQKLFAFLKEKGLNTQKSVFECDIDADDIKKIHAFVDELALESKDSVLIHPLCQICSRKAVLLGCGIRFVQKDWMVI